MILAPKKVLEYFGIKDFLDAASFDYFSNLIKHILAERRSKGAVQNDLVQALLEAKADEEDLNNFESNHSKLTANVEGIFSIFKMSSFN